ncbi:CULLIN-2 domain-containing protein [Aphelenchoides besseyi]|nr:CULLIN-2 domain-containing protein [Aphelenchoides besseyi]
MSIMVWTTSVWLATSSIQFEIPTVLQLSVDKFTIFYQNRHNVRRLSFQLVASRGELLNSALNKRYTLITTLAQISILMLYNDCEEYSIQEIERKLNNATRLSSHVVASDRQERSVEMQRGLVGIRRCDFNHKQKFPEVGFRMNSLMEFCVLAKS